MSGGYELQRTDAKGEGVFATRSFQVGETVMAGVIEPNSTAITPMPRQRETVRAARRANRQGEPLVRAELRIQLNASGARNFVARQPITASQEITFDYAMRNYTVSTRHPLPIRLATLP